MDEKTYNILLTIILVIIGTALLIGGGIIISMHFKNKDIEDNSNQMVERVKKIASENKKTSNNDKKGKGNTGDLEGGSGPSSITDVEFSKNQTGGSKIPGVRMEEYNVVGVVKIPKINVEYPILEKVTKRSLEIAVAQLATQRGINNPGNTTVLGHNYRNNLFFAKLHLLTNGDKIIVTDMSGRVVTYEVYEVATRKPSDTSYVSRETDGKVEISLSTCNDDSTLRHVVLAREVEN